MTKHQLICVMCKGKAFITSSGVTMSCPRCCGTGVIKLIPIGDQRSVHAGVLNPDRRRR